MKVIHVVGAAILRDGRCLAAKRGSRVSSPGMWELPGGKVEPNESPPQALRREIREELSIDIEVGAWLGRGVDETGARRIELDIYAARWLSGDLVLSDHSEVRWLDADQLGDVAWALADRPVLPAIAKLLGA